jgi:glycerol-3-phosphate dehydrogenase (NAD(P)+)
VLIGKGMEIEAAMAEAGGVVEGYYAAAAAWALSARAGVEMPICCEIYRVLYEGKDLRQVLTDLMSRGKRAEHTSATADWMKQ